MYFQGEYRLIGEFESKEKASLACEITQAIFNPKQASRMRRDQVRRMVHSARTLAWNAASPSSEADLLRLEWNLHHRGK